MNCYHLVFPSTERTEERRARINGEVVSFLQLTNHCHPSAALIWSHLVKSWCANSTCRDLQKSPSSCVIAHLQVTVSGFFSFLSDVMFNVSKEFQLICALGDFNMPDIDWNHPEKSNGHSNVNVDFIYLMQSYFMNQLNNVPSNCHMHILDLIFTNSDGLIGEVSDFQSDYETDHAVIYFELSLRVSKKKRSLTRCLQLQENGL
eukprot:GHVO01049691.1.p1 GENE.GHVO01049691.1~~GHVO01049691.1.p1  ORF type:complete len:204 (-),score=2.92 GHVO01049691.1:737-1348(-)